MIFYRHTFCVVGRRFAGFPIDMLRYDRCTPWHEQDSANILRTIEDNVDDRLAIGLMAVNGDKDWAPTLGRWKSFGWELYPDSLRHERVG